MVVLHQCITPFTAVVNTINTSLSIILMLLYKYITCYYRLGKRLHIDKLVDLSRVHVFIYELLDQNELLYLSIMKNHTSRKNIYKNLLFIESKI